MNDKSVLAVFAHPDDETYRAGGTLALLAAGGFRVNVLTATRGEAGSCGTPPLCTVDELPLVREQELRCACRALGLEPPKILGYPDGQLASIDPNKLIANILEVSERTNPQIMISFGEDGISGHPDHIAIGRCAWAAFQQRTNIQAFIILAVPQFIADALGMKQIYATPDVCITHAVDVSKVWKAKVQAIRCHQTQVQESPILKADQEDQALFLRKEHFCAVEIRNQFHRQGDRTMALLDRLAD